VIGATGWCELWRELCEAQARARRSDARTDPADHWSHRARAFAAGVARRWSAPDSSRVTVAAWLDAHPGASLLDIGAGTGAWAAFLSPRAARVTAVEPSSGMVEVLRETLAASGAANVTVVPRPWPDGAVGPHDVTLCAHAMYGAADFAGFVRGLERVTRRHVFLLLRAPDPDGVMAEATRRVRGHPHDSPNFQVGYNALLELGIFPDVVMEAGLWEPWSHASLEEALAEVKRRLGLPAPSEHDAFLADLLARRLARVDGGYLWPRATHSALVHWDVERYRAGAA
jgi:SAM-dependent methyltransferase